MAALLQTEKWNIEGREISNTNYKYLALIFSMHNCWSKVVNTLVEQAMKSKLRDSLTLPNV